MHVLFPGSNFYVLKMHLHSEVCWKACWIPELLKPRFERELRSHVRVDQDWFETNPIMTAREYLQVRASLKYVPGCSRCGPAFSCVLPDRLAHCQSKRSFVGGLCKTAMSTADPLLHALTLSWGVIYARFHPWHLLTLEIIESGRAEAAEGQSLRSFAHL